jgi:hypothetical protein
MGVEEQRGRVSDGEIWTAHGGVNPCGLFIRRGGGGGGVWVRN